MAIGLGLVLSTILVIAAWQLDQRNAWGKAGQWTHVPDQAARSA